MEQKDGRNRQRREGMSVKEAASFTQERKKLKDLEYLKATNTSRSIYFS